MNKGYMDTKKPKQWTLTQEEFNALFKEQPISKFQDELNAATTPRSILFVGNGIIEFFVNTIIKSRCKNKAAVGRIKNHSVKLLLLNECGVLTDQQFKVLDSVRELRNKAAHRFVFEVNNEDLANLGSFSSDEDYVPSGVGTVVYGYRELDPKSSDFLNRWFYYLITDLWNAFIKDLVPDFLPMLHNVDISVNIPKDDQAAPPLVEE